MKRKSMISLLTAGVICISTMAVAGRQTVFAAAPENGAASSAIFELTNKGDTEEPGDIVDPEEPKNEIDPDPDGEEEGGRTEHKGRLRIDYVSNFHFEDGDVSSEDQVLRAALIEANSEHTESGRITVPNFVQVSDWRGTGEGWTLSVKQNDYFSVSSGRLAGTPMEGARLVLDNVTARTANTGKEVLAPNSSINLDAIDQYQQVLVAEEGTGLGTHVAHFGDYNKGESKSALASVSLEIPKSAKKLAAAYKTTLTWQLTDVPGNPGENEEVDFKITVDKAAASIGDMLVYTVEIENNTDETLSFTMADYLPKNLKFEGNKGIDGATGVVFYWNEQKNRFKYEDNLNPGERSVMELRCTILSGNPGDVIENMANLAFKFWYKDNTSSERHEIVSNIVKTVIE